jgi:hypothetical protein
MELCSQDLHPEPNISGPHHLSLHHYSMYPCLPNFHGTKQFSGLFCALHEAHVTAAMYASQSVTLHSMSFKHSLHHSILLFCSHTNVDAVCTRGRGADKSLVL